MATYANNWRLSRNFELLHSALQQQQQHKQQQDKLEKIAKSLQPQKQLMLLAERSLKGTRRESEDERRAPA